MLDYGTAIRRAVQDASREGASVLYPSGHADKLDVAVRRATLTGVNQTCGQISETLAWEFGCDLMEITAHAGARPEHAVWQGQIVSLSGRRGYLSLSDIGYGTGAGFMGWNCRHSWNPFFEGISERSYTPEALERLNARDIEYNGQKYTEYEISQMQRKLEREIRATKRELTAFDAAGLKEDFARQSVKLKAQEARLREFTGATGQRVDSARVQVQGFGHSQASKAVWANKAIEKQRQYDIMIAEIKSAANIPKAAIVNIPAKIVDTSDFRFDDAHINIDRKHNVTREQAETWIKKAKISITVWAGKYERFYSSDGAVYINSLEKTIRTAFSAGEYDENIKAVMEVLEKYGY